MSRTTTGLAPRPAGKSNLPPIFSWPPPDYWARGPPRRIETKFTTYGYEVTLVRQRGGHYKQESRPTPLKAARPRSDACLVRPERSLSVNQILAGAYFARPDPEAFVRLLREQHEAASTKKAPLPPVGSVGQTACVSDTPFELDGSKLWNGLSNTGPAASTTVLEETPLASSTIVQ
mmetsp:Transcript_36406/g.95995  ORF Transcript_36406/g.95995 Transcript_36406/m.95995 type:complete len:176 (+) Transcript_36406:124-651(+)|eukprot:CAMPEP_0115844416 /NCGR_PEP_ID=MMETSP0287-20121206/8817_1 /TAXON_ID=412157 /ORGANISM="Chrysochromulina rotalis, Strain UIO044" /LENGTH=175 /DNA_ID=CAMNT_0003298141 /DNA_START=40 /DNA_END=567 /DNA_ORIENTATION=-